MAPIVASALRLLDTWTRTVADHRRDLIFAKLRAL
jgi:hypothetical protein